MMRHRVFLILLCITGFTNKLYAEQVSSAEIAQEVDAYIRNILSNEKQHPSDDYKVVVSNLDPRLKLKACEHSLNMRVASPRPYGSNLSVKVSCKAPKKWTIYVPAHIEQYADVAIVSRSMQRGSIISTDDVVLSRQNVAQVGKGYLRDPQRAVGLQLKRPLQSGQPLRLSHLKEPQIVKRGDKVILEAGNKSINVVTIGHALNAGQLGEQIKVRNEKSQRVVDATVVAPGKVRVSVW